jgi:hypothetical protein
MKTLIFSLWVDAGCTFGTGCTGCIFITDCTFGTGCIGCTLGGIGRTLLI